MLALEIVTLTKIRHVIQYSILGFSVFLCSACKISSASSSSSDESITNNVTPIKGLTDENVVKFNRIFLAHARVAITNGGTVPLLIAGNLQTALLKARESAGGYPSPQQLRGIFMNGLIELDSRFGNLSGSAKYPNPKSPTDRKTDIRISRVLPLVFKSIIDKTGADLRITPSAELMELKAVLEATRWDIPNGSSLPEAT